ncbi:hypothetical protein Tco_1286643 [Tanacetum coccineum]
MGTPTLVCVWSYPNFSSPAGRPFRDVNPRTVTNITIDKHGRFDMLFISIGVVIPSFVNCLRRMFIIYGANLKNDFYIGFDILAVGMDGNNKILPIDFGMFQGEDDKGWAWF